MKTALRSPADRLAPGRALTLANVAEGAEGLVVADLARAIAARPKAPAVSLAVICRDGPRMSQLARSLEFLLGQFEKAAAIGGPGQAVGGGQHTQLFLHAGALLDL